MRERAYFGVAYADKLGGVATALRNSKKSAGGNRARAGEPGGRQLPLLAAEQAALAETWRRGLSSKRAKV